VILAIYCLVGECVFAGKVLFRRVGKRSVRLCAFSVVGQVVDIAAVGGANGVGALCRIANTAQTSPKCHFDLGFSMHVLVAKLMLPLLRSLEMLLRNNLFCSNMFVTCQMLATSSTAKTSLWPSRTIMI
jgi:hypothetical protein